MATSKQKMENQKGGMKTPSVVSPQEWLVARQAAPREGEGLDPLP
jgi:hypothetical protein